MSRCACPYPKSEVELTEERERHIAERHPDLLPKHRHRIAETRGQPDHVRRSARFGSAKSFSRWYADIRPGKHVVAVAVSELDPTERHCIITAYMARKLAEGDIEWKRD